MMTVDDVAEEEEELRRSRCWCDRWVSDHLLFLLVMAILLLDLRRDRRRMQGRAAAVVFASSLDTAEKR